ncbi:hypothetical protein Tco_0535544 [Tanacetum coccineum]
MSVPMRSSNNLIMAHFHEQTLVELMMEILLGATSNKLLVEDSKYLINSYVLLSALRRSGNEIQDKHGKSNTYVLEDSYAFELETLSDDFFESSDHKILKMEYGDAHSS